MRIALIGCGFFAHNHVNAWNDIPDAELVAICDLNSERLELAAQLVFGARTFQDPSDLFAWGDFDVVDIATTVNSHHKLVLQAAQHNVHVICQKPFALNLFDAREMTEAVGKTGKVLMVHENFRWQSAIRAVIEDVRNNVIGTPFFARVSFRSGFDVYKTQPYLAESKRFIIEDLGIHALDVARALMGDVIDLFATTQKINPKIKGEDVATIMLRHESGSTSVVDCSYATKQVPETFPETLLEINGIEGTLKLDAGYKYRLHKNGKVIEKDLSPSLLPWASKPWHNIQESVLATQRNFVESVLNNVEPETNGADNLKTFALVEGAYLSANEHRVIKVSEL